MPVRSPYHDGPITDHFDGTRFLNPGEPETDRTLRDVLRWIRTAQRTPWPKSLSVNPIVPDARVEGLRVTMLRYAILPIGAYNPGWFIAA